MSESVTWYVARNHLGQFNRGRDWVEGLARARLHRKIGPAKTAATLFVKENPEAPVPEILEWKVDLATARVIDVAEQTRKRIVQIEDRKLAREQANAKWRLEELAKQEQRIADERARLRGKL